MKQNANIASASSTTAPSSSILVPTTGSSFSKFVTMEKPPAICNPNLSDEMNFKKPGGDDMGLGSDYDVYGGPKKKEIRYMKETEKLDMISYFFDYLDDLMQKDISIEFEILAKSASLVPEEDLNKFDEPYTVQKLLFYFSKGKDGKDPWKKSEIPTNNYLDAEKIKLYKPDFNVNLWKNSFSAAKISNIMKTFGWGSPNTADKFYFKKLIDRFNFSGTGRLNTREFIFYAIWEHYKSPGQCKEQCFKKVIEEKIDPLFSFLDCDNDGFLNSENIWNGFKYLKRSDQSKYNIYNCELPHTYNKFYRTVAVNDFILKNSRVADGYVNKEEFRKGILLGYWERQVKKSTAVKDDSINKKSERWENDGALDIDCEELVKIYERK